MHRSASCFLSASAFLFFAMLAAFGQTVETMDLHKAIELGRVKAQVTGSGIEQVSAKVTRTRNAKPLKVRVPIGTLFVSGSDSAQNMVATGAEVVDLSAVTSAEFTVSAACANLHLDVPGEEDNFSVQAGPEQEELTRVLPVVRAAGSAAEVIQAAVWIITDNADYDDLGTLVVGFGGFGSRAINEPEASRAMMLLEKAKVDLKEKAIWEDRVTVCEEVAGTKETASAWCSVLLRDTTDLSWRLESADSEKRGVREAARAGLARESSPEALPGLLEALPKLKGEAAASIVKGVGNYTTPETVALLSKLMESDDRPVRLAAAQILAKSEEAELRASAQAVLAKMRPAVPAKAAAKPASAKPAVKK